MEFFFRAVVRAVAGPARAIFRVPLRDDIECSPKSQRERKLDRSSAHGRRRPATMTKRDFMGRLGSLEWKRNEKTLAPFHTALVRERADDSGSCPPLRRLSDTRCSPQSKSGQRSGGQRRQIARWDASFLAWRLSSILLSRGAPRPPPFASRPRHAEPNARGISYLQSAAIHGPP